MSQFPHREHLVDLGRQLRELGIADGACDLGGVSKLTISNERASALGRIRVVQAGLWMSSEAAGGLAALIGRPDLAEAFPRGIAANIKQSQPCGNVEVTIDAGEEDYRGAIESHAGAHDVTVFKDTDTWSTYFGGSTEEGQRLAALAVPGVVIPVAEQVLKCAQFALSSGLLGPL